MTDRKQMLSLSRWHIHIDLVEEEGGGHFARAFVFPGAAIPPAMFCAAKETAADALVALFKEIKPVIETKK